MTGRAGPARSMTSVGRGLGRIGQPPIGEAGHPPHRRAAAAGQPDRRTTRSRRRRREPHVSEAEVLPPIGHRFSRPESAHGVDRLRHPADPAGEFDTQRGELGLGGRGRKPAAHARDHSPVRQSVECGELVRQQDRMAQRREQHRGPQGDPLGGLGRGSQHQQWIRAWPGDRTVAGPHRVETQVLRSPRLCDKPFRVVVAEHGLVTCRQQVSDFQPCHLASGSSSGSRA